MPINAEEELCMYDITINEDGSYSSKTEYSYDNNGNKTCSTYSNWNGNYWELSKKYEYAYDINGVQVLNASFKWENNEWVGVSKTEKTYDDHGNLVLNASSNWKDGMWNITSGSKNEYVYDDDGNITYNVSFKWQNNDWVGISRTERAYVNNQEVLYMRYEWQNGEWVMSFKKVNSYDANGNITYSESNTYNNGLESSKTERGFDVYGNKISEVSYLYINNEWEARTKYIYTYENGHKDMQYEYIYETYCGQWIDVEKIVFSYDVEGYFVRSDQYRFFYYLSPDGGYEGEWKHTGVTEFTYDFAFQGDVADDVLGGKLVSCIYYTVNDDDELEIHQGEKIDREYDAHGNIQNEVKYEWQNGEWVDRSGSVYSYNEDGELTYSMGWVFDNPLSLFGNYKNENFYDANGNVIKHIEYDWKNSSWVEKAMKESTYDDDNRITSTSNYIWNNEQWEGTNKNTYEYNDNGSKTRMGYCEWKDGDWNEYKYIIYYYSDDPSSVNAAAVSSSVSIRKIVRDGKLRIEDGMHIYGIGGEQIK